MSEHGYQFQKKVTVPATGNIAVALPSGRPLLQQLTVWASSGTRVVTGLTFQPRINGKNLGSSVAVTTVVAADVVYDDPRVIPAVKGSLSAPGTVDAFEFDILITSSHGSPQDVTLVFAAVGRDGGPQ